MKIEVYKQKIVENATFHEEKPIIKSHWKKKFQIEKEVKNVNLLNKSFVWTVVENPSLRSEKILKIKV